MIGRLALLTGLILGFAGFAQSSRDATSWSRRAAVESPTGNLYFSHDWNRDRGIRLRFRSLLGDQEVEVAISAAAHELHLPSAAERPPSLKRPSRLNRRAVPSVDGVVEMTLKIRSHHWTLYVDEQPLLTMPAVFPAPLEMFQPAGDLPPEGEDDSFFQRVEPFAFTDDFLVAEEEDNLLAAWTKLSGTWGLHTAIDSSLERKTIARGAARGAPEPSRSPNFYSLSGKGEPAIIAAGYEFHDSYSQEAAMFTQPGEMGLVFYLSEDGPMHGFTVTIFDDGSEALFRLWRSETTDCKRRYVLAAATAAIDQGQWIKLKTVVTDGRVRTWVDYTQLFDQRLALPPGGMYGLYAHAEETIRFDDFAVASFRELDLRDFDGLSSQALAITGGFAGQTNGFKWFREKPTELTLVMPHEHPEGKLVVGGADDPPHWFKFDVTALQGDYEVGMLTGYRTSAAPHYRFTYRHRQGIEHFILEKMTAGESRIVEQFRLPATIPVDRRVSLACDATTPGLLKYYRNGALVLAKAVEEEVSGASGAWVARNAKVAFASFEYRFSPPPVFRNKFEKNRIFATDPFMRHWSSPEGEWIEMPDGRTWYKGDFFGRFALHMPHVAGSEIHLSVAGDDGLGEYVLTSSPTALSLIDAAADGDGRTLAEVRVDRLEAGIAPAEKVTPPARVFTIEVEDHVLQLRSNQQLLAQVYLEKPLSGRRVRIAGFSNDDLMHSHVDRYNVQDFLFTDSLYNWTINGGSWEIVNRFQCQPRWSHMNGESAHGLAALWSKFDFEGDFCIEMYAGMRHGWYERAGDLNLTVLNRDGTPSQGYTVTTTGWDEDHSQLWTRFFKNGKEIARSEKYLVPRIREGSVRRGHNPLIADGRPVHGAWYYLKLRRIGDIVEFHFDNELVFSVRDKAPIESGGLGVWTFMNSMMVARVKGAAEVIRPRRIAVRQVALDYRPPPAPSLRTLSYRDRDGVRSPLTEPGLWSVHDEVGHPRLAWHRETDGTPYMTVETQLGGGQFLAIGDLAPQAYENIAGWLMYVKRTENAQFNFHYTIGSVAADGRYVPVKHCFHRISGMASGIAGYLPGGASEVPPVGPAGDEWHRQGDWTPVVVWIDAIGEAAREIGPGWQVKPVGFGNLKPSDVSQGLTGNGPGEAYAVKNLVPIRFGHPRFLPRDESPLPTGYVIRDSDNRAIGRGRTVEDVNAMLAKIDGAGLRKISLEIQADQMSKTLPVWWVNPPDKPAVRFSWSEDVAGQVMVDSAGGFPDRRFLRGAATINGLPVVLRQETIDRLVAHLPRSPEITADSPLQLSYSADGEIVARGLLDWQDSAIRQRPVLLGIEGASPLVLTFEKRALTAPLAVDATRMRLAFDPDRERSYLEVGNRGGQYRLQTIFNQSVDLSRFPILQFDYRGPKTANVSIDLGGGGRIAFSETQASAKAVRYAPDSMRQDGRWHSWMGLATDGITGGGLGRPWFSVANFQFRSTHQRDQTGLYSVIDLDNLVVGPAVATADQLVVKPDFHDPAGVDAVLFCVYGGAAPYASLGSEARASLQWSEVEPETEIRPSRLPGDGPGHLLIKARNRLGLESNVFDLPFLVDTVAPQAEASFVTTKDPKSNGTMLRVDFDIGDGSPLDLTSLSIKWNDQKVVPDPAFSTFAHTENKDVLTLNWPHIFRRQLNDVADGQSNAMVVAGIRDGAGNAAADLSIAFKTDHSQDTTGPTLVSSNLSESVLWGGEWHSPTVDNTSLQVSQHDTLSLEKTFGQAPYVVARHRRDDLQVWKPFARNEWSLDKFPYFAFNIRRPAYRADQKTTVELFVSFDGRKHYVFPVAGDAKGSLGMELGRDFKWSANSWTGGVFDLRAIMLETLTREVMAEAEKAGNLESDTIEKYRLQAARTIARSGVRMVGFRVVNPSSRDILHIRDMYVLRPWEAGDSVLFDAYDASGVAGLTVAAGLAERTLTSMSFTPARTPESEWLLVRVRDKAGNHGPEIWLPGRQAVP